MQNPWRRTITMYVDRADYNLIMSKAKNFDLSASKFTQQAVKAYIKHLDKYSEDTRPDAA